MTLPRFAEAIEAVLSTRSERPPVYSSEDPGTRVKFTGPAKAWDYWYQVRCNVTHRGKSAFQDGQLVYDNAVDLHNALRLFLEETPGLSERWSELAGGRSNWLLPPGAALRLAP